MAKTSIGNAIVIIAVLVAFLAATSGPAAALPKTNSGNRSCERSLRACLTNCEGLPGKGTPGGAYERCHGRCAVRAADCTDKLAESASVPSTNPAPSKGAGGFNPVTGGTQPPVGDGGTKPSKRPIGVHPITPVNPVGVNQPGSGSGSGVTVYYKSGAGKSFTTTRPSGFNTIKEKDWATTSGPPSSNQSQHQGRHR
jgi:hypothetical protein